MNGELKTSNHHQIRHAKDGKLVFLSIPPHAVQSSRPVAGRGSAESAGPTNIAVVRPLGVKHPDTAGHFMQFARLGAAKLDALRDFESPERDAPELERLLVERERKSAKGESCWHGLSPVSGGAWRKPSAACVLSASAVLERGGLCLMLRNSGGDSPAVHVYLSVHIE
jgi:hypothetical protein